MINPSWTCSAITGFPHSRLPTPVCALSGTTLEPAKAVTVFTIITILQITASLSTGKQQEHFLHTTPRISKYCSWIHHTIKLEDGSGIVVFQYESVRPTRGQDNDVDYETIGIQAPGGLVGLLYRFNNTGQPGAAPIASIHRTITITTESSISTGNLQGVVVDAENSQPLEGVEISIDGEGVIAVTDASGLYTAQGLITGSYTLRAVKSGYNDGIIENFIVEMDSTEIGNFSMLHPEVALSTDHIEVTLPGDPQEASFTIENDGNGPLDYHVIAAYTLNGEETEDWKVISDYDFYSLTNHIQLRGCELMRDIWYVSATRNTDPGPNLFFKFSRDGNYLGSFDQVLSDQSLGIRDLATDGNLIYGSYGQEILGFDANGNIQQTILGATHISPQKLHCLRPCYRSFLGVGHHYRYLRT